MRIRPDTGSGWRNVVASALAAAAALMLCLCLTPRAAAQQWTCANGSCTTTGNVGVGTSSSPAVKLEVDISSANTSYGSMTAADIPAAIRNTSATAGNMEVFGFWDSAGWGIAHVGAINVDHTNHAGQLFFSTKPSGGSITQRMLIDQNGNVGIGTMSPAVTLHVAAASADAITRIAQFYQPSLSTTNNYSFISVGKANAADQAAAFGFLMNTAGNDSAFITVAGDDPTAGTGLFVRKGGNVGIGTSSPGTVLHVVGNGVSNRGTLAVRDTGGPIASALYPYISFFGSDEGAGGTNRGGFVGVSGGNFYVGGDAGITGKLFITTGGAGNARITVDNVGNVGVGTTSPGANYRLDVSGGAHVSGDMTVDGNLAAKYQDVAEWVPSAQKLQAGTVVVLDTTRTNHVLASTKEYDTRVAGVVSDNPGVILGQGGEGRLKVATTGRVKVKVDATKAPIKVGDLLVTSDKEGVAMRSVPLLIGGREMHAPGTIIGKALEPLAGGTGEILVLLSLQ